MKGKYIQTPEITWALSLTKKNYVDFLLIDADQCEVCIAEELMRADSIYKHTNDFKCVIMGATPDQKHKFLGRKILQDSNMLFCDKIDSNIFDQTNKPTYIRLDRTGRIIDVIAPSLNDTKRLIAFKKFNN